MLQTSQIHLRNHGLLLFLSDYHILEACGCFFKRFNSKNMAAATDAMCSLSMHAYTITIAKCLGSAENCRKLLIEN